MLYDEEKLIMNANNERGNLFICIYDDNTKVGLFERKTVKCMNSEDFAEMDIYTEFDGCLIGIFGKKREMNTSGLKRKYGLWLVEGQTILSEEGKAYTSNCQLNKFIYFSDLYRKLTSFHGPIELSTNNIEKVLDYVCNYYDVERPKVKLKK